MLCALLRAVKIFFVGNTLFSSHAIVHLDRNLTLAAITYHLEHHALHIDHTVTLVQDARYHACFKDHPHTVANRYLFLGPELKERTPFLVGVTRFAPCPYSSVSPKGSSEDNQHIQGNPNDQGSQSSVLPKKILPSKGPMGGEDTESSYREPSPSDSSSPSGAPSPRARPSPSSRPFVSEENKTNTSPSPTPHHVITNTIIPIWVHSASGRTIQPIRNHNVSGSENRSYDTGANVSNHTDSIHGKSNHTSTELILEPTRIWARRNTNPRHRLPDRNVTLSDVDRILSLMDSEDSEDSEWDEWDEWDE